MGRMIPVLIWIVVWLLSLLVSEWKNWNRGIWISKPFASLGLLAFYFCLSPEPLSGATENILLVAAISFCILGDVLLIPESEKIFLIGIGSFALGHVGYLGNFILHIRGNQNEVSIGPVAIVIAVSGAITFYLWNKIPRMLRPAVLGYVVLISGLVIAASALALRPGGHLLLAGAIAFYLSDISVALDRFVERKFIYRLWGLPLYYLAQVMIITGLCAFDKGSLLELSFPF